MLPGSPPAPTFADHYQALQEQSQVRLPVSEGGGPLLTFSANAQPLREFVRQVSNLTGVSIVIDQALDEQPVTVEVVDQSVDQVLSMVARRLSVQATRSGSMYFLGTLRKEDRGILVRRVRRLSQDEISLAVHTLLSDHGATASFGDGLVVIGDRVEVLARVDDLLNQVEAAESSTWVVQLYLVSLADRDLHDLGIDGTPALDLSVAFAGASSQLGGFSIAPQHHLSAGLQALLRAAKSQQNVGLIAEPLFYLADGEKARLVRGDRVPIPVREQFAANGATTSTTTYTMTQTGLILNVQLRELSSSSAALTVHTELSEITGYVDDVAPITTTEEYETRANVSSGGVFLVGAIERSQVEKKRSVGLRFGETSSAERRLLQIWCRAVRVGSPSVAAGTATERSAAGAERSEGAGLAAEPVEQLPSPAPSPLQETEFDR